MGSSPPRIVVYTTDFCAWCTRAKELLDRRGVAYREEWIPRTSEGFARLAERVPGARSFPQIVIDGAPIGGFQDLVELDRRRAAALRGAMGPNGEAGAPDTA